MKTQTNSTLLFKKSSIIELSDLDLAKILGAKPLQTPPTRPTSNISLVS